MGVSGVGVSRVGKEEEEDGVHVLVGGHPMSNSFLAIIPL